MRKRGRGGTDFSAEIEAHIRIEADCYRAQGMSEEEAVQAARRAFGNVDQAAGAVLRIPALAVVGFTAPGPAARGAAVGTRRRDGRQSPC